jgi:hypothetical protein
MVKGGTFPFEGFYPYDEQSNVEQSIINKRSFDLPQNILGLLNSKLTLSNAMLSCMNLNCRSVSVHHSDISLLLHTLSFLPTVCVLTETWLHHDYLHLPFNDYQQFNVCRPKNKQGGGVSILLHPSIVSTEFVTNVCPTTFEFIGRQFTIHNLPVVCIGVYRPHNVENRLFFEDLDNLLLSVKSALHCNSLVLLAGDFNIGLLDDSSVATGFLNMLISHTLYPTIFLPTRPDSKALLDNIFTSWPNFTASYVLSAHIADHLPMLSIFDLGPMYKSQSENHKVRLRRHFTTTSISNFISHLGKENWESVYRLYDPSSSCNEFYSIFSQHFNTCFPPLPEKSKKSGRKPWITQALCNSAKQLNSLYKKYITGLIPTSNSAILYRLIRQAKHEHFSAFFENNSKNTKAVWNLINLMKTGPAASSVPSVDANELNTFFATLSSRMVSSLPAVQNSGPLNNVPVNNHN